MGSQVLIPLQTVQKGEDVDETVLKVKGQTCYLWAAIDVDTNEILAVYASRRGIPSAIKKVLDSCEGKPFIVVRWALDRLGITYFHETFGNRNRIERLFREMKERTKRFYNNVNSLKCLEELITAIAAMHNIIRAGGGEVIPTCQYRLKTTIPYINIRKQTYNPDPAGRKHTSTKQPYKQHNQKRHQIIQPRLRYEVLR
jgi:hypothetical protein